MSAAEFCPVTAQHQFFTNTSKPLNSFSCKHQNARLTCTIIVPTIRTYDYQGVANSGKRERLNPGAELHSVGVNVATALPATHYLISETFDPHSIIYALML